MKLTRKVVDLGVNSSNGSNLDSWKIQDAKDLYGIENWGLGYFDVDEDGQVEIRPQGQGSGKKINLVRVVRGLKERGVAMPVLLRFSDILDSRIAAINEGFATAIRENDYQASYRGVYPIKVNQQEQVIEEIISFGKRYKHGLEAGSKAELIAALSYMQDSEGFLICNGYKDAEFIDLALSGQRLGIRVILVVEMPGELDLMLERAQLMGVRPVIGVRVRLSTKASGHWVESGGDRSVFGLNTSQIITVVDKLRKCGMLDCLQMLHYHLGSQIPNIRNIRDALAEACRFYVDLVGEGAPMGILDVGGGLAVDYDGSNTNYQGSRNYSLEEYCADIIEVVKTVANEAEIPHPIIVSESGRATIAYYSVLVFNVLEAGRFDPGEIPDSLPEDSAELLVNLFEVTQSLTLKNLQESFHDAMYYRDEIRSCFVHGSMSLRERAMSEQLFWHIVSKISTLAQKLKYVPEELQGLGTALADIYYANFSVFQSLPDSWAIEQLFPIMPIHRLGEQPSRQAILADITCDCDGKIDRFIDLHDVRHSLELHPLQDDDDYYLGAFLVGAYQETLGDLHNLLGDTNVVSLRIEENGDIEFTKELLGDTVADVLSYVEYDPKLLLDRFRRTAENAVRRKQITPQERRHIVRAFEEGLRGYTYFEE